MTYTRLPNHLPLLRELLTIIAHCTPASSTSFLTIDPRCEQTKAIGSTRRHILDFDKLPVAQRASARRNTDTFSLKCSELSSQLASELAGWSALKSVERVKGARGALNDRLDKLANRLSFSNCFTAHSCSKKSTRCGERK